MNSETLEDNPNYYYYDSDYPSESMGIYRENFDQVTEFQGIAYDVPRYCEIAKCTSGAILELCCGSGRVSIPLARNGHRIVAVDIARPMLSQFEANLQREPSEVARRIELTQADVSKLALKQKFGLIICPFNSLLLIPDFQAQLRTLHVVREHLAPNGIFVLDVVNPLVLKIDGDSSPMPFFTRRNPHSGNKYTRFAMSDPFDQDNRQRLFGYYDEIDPQGVVRRQHYSFFWRPIFRFELELMLRVAGLSIVKLEAGHRGEPFSSARSPNMFIQAQLI